MSSEIKVDTISENTSANGVVIDSVTLKDGAVTATAASTITTADNTDTLTLTSTDADANTGPNLKLTRNSSSPADGDVTGEISFVAENDNDEAITYSQISSRIDDASDGTEDGRLFFYTMVGGSSTERLRFNGTETAFNEGSADLDFRVESNGNAQMLMVNGGTDRVGIGLDPGVTFDVQASVAGDLIGRFNNFNANPFVMALQMTGGSPDNNTNYFLACSDATTTRMLIRSDGDLYNHDNTYGAISDERIKQDIRDANSQWDDIKAVKVRNYKKKDDVRQYGDKAWEQIGVVAQELESAGMDKLVKESDPTPSDVLSDASFGTLYEDGDTIPDGKEIGDVKEVKATVKGVSYSVLYMKAIKALQEAMARIETLEAEVTALKGE